MKKEFKPFEKVIIKGKEEYHVWTPEFFSYYEADGFFVIGGRSEGYDFQDTDILPYKDNEHLVGTSDMPEEEVTLKQGEYVVVSDFYNHLSEGIGVIRRYYDINADNIRIKDVDGTLSFSYCVPLKHFNPNDMEETRKHILCAKNGKLVKVKL